MTVSAQTPSVEYIEDGVTTAFPVPFRYNAPGHIKAVRIGTDGVETVLVYGTDYTVSAGAGDAGGTLTATVPGAAGVVLAITRDTPREQPTDYETLGKFTASSHEAALDRYALIAQEQDRELARAPKVAPGETAPAIGAIAEGQVLGLVGGRLIGLDNDPVDAAQSAAEARASAEAADAVKGQVQDLHDETVDVAAAVAADAADVRAANTYRTGIARDTLANLNALAGPFDEGDSAAVYGDSTAANNGIYSYTAGVWTKLADLPDVAAAEAADRAEAAAAELQTTTRIGSPDQPIDGTVSSNNRFVEETAVAQTALYDKVTLFAKATGTIDLTAERRVGNTFTVTRSVQAVVTGTGLQTVDLSEPLLIVAGEWLGYLGSGVLAYNSPADSGRRVYGSSAGDLNPFNDSAVADVSFELYLHSTASTVDGIIAAQEAINQGAISGPPEWVEDAARYEIDFTRGLYWNPDEGKVEPLGGQLFVQSEVGWSLDSKGRLVKFPANRPRLTDRGLRIEAFDVTNLLGSPFAPFTQTIALGAGTYTVSCGLGGSVTVRDGLTDLDRALPGLPVVFTLAAAKDITFAVSGPPEWAQCQAGEFATMPVSGTRTGDIVTPYGRLAEVLGDAAYTAIVEVENIMPNVNVATAAPILGGAGTTVVLNRRLASNSAGMFVSGGASINHEFTGTFEQIVRAVVTGDATTAAISANGKAATSDADPLPATRWLGRDGSTVPSGGPQSGMFIRKIAFEPAKVSTAEAALLSAPPERIRKETINYPSSIDAADYPTLDATICYDELRANAPVLVIMHGWAQSMTDFNEQVYHRLARRGFFVVAPNMRGRPGSIFSARDASAREIVDILDAVEVVRARYPEFAHARDAYMFGYSGGGGNVLATAMKAPDAFNLFVSHFGMSDYGYDATYGWHTTDPGFASEIATAVGGAPGASAAVNAAYRSRYAIEGVPANLQGGHLIMLHDVADALVDVEHSRQMAAAMQAGGNTHWTLYESAATNWNRWEHGLPNDLAKVVRSENLLLPAILRKTYRAWTFPLTGTARVHGFLRTRHFEIVLDDRKSSVATVTFDVKARSYTVTPVTTHAPIDVTVRQGALTASQTIDAATVLVAE